MSNSTAYSVETTLEAESRNTKKREKPQKKLDENVNKRKGKRWSKVWIDFDDVELEEGESPEDVKAMCKHCGDKFKCHPVKHGNKNLKRHLLKCKPYLAKQSKSQTNIMFDHGDGKMMAWKFDQKESRKALAHMVIVDELPFSFVERQGFRHYSKINQPLFDVPCRGANTQDCYKLYDDEKNKLLNVIQKNIGRVCLTTDSWTSLQKKSYMALTGHFIDNEWKLNKKVLNFCRLDGHSGVDIGKGVESCVNEWGIDAIMAISVDNASANDSAIDFLRRTFAKKDNCLLNGKWIHIRCAAHILNLVVQDGIKSVDMSIANIRYAVKWIKKSGTRIEKFKRCAESAKCDITKNLILDVPTRWNSTYNMLEVAQAYEDGFERYDLEDADFGNAIRKKGLLVPTHEDWDKARKLCGFLKVFYDVTLRISGTKYVTSHTLIVELSAIRELLRKQIFCDVLKVPPQDEILCKIAKVMKKKFDKYYGEIENMNALLYFAFLLDPRNKDEFLHIVVDDHYGDEGLAMVELKKNYIHAEFKALYEDYVRIHAPPSNSSSVLGKQADDTTANPPTRDRLRDKMKSTSASTSTISELDKYLCESVEVFNSNVKFYILAWWKVNSPRFPILSLMARDLLAIPVSTVASESVFSTSGRVLDTFRSSLSDKSIESLICTQDWLRKDKDKILEQEEDFETIIIDSSEDEGTSSKRDINEDGSFYY